MKMVTSRRMTFPAARWLLALLILGAALAGAASSYAAPALQSAQGITLSARAGFDGYYKDGFWVPVRLTVANDGPDLSGTLRIAVPRDYGTAETVYSRAVDLPTQSRREIFLYVVPEGVMSSLKVALVNEKNKPVKEASVRMAQVTPADLLYGVWAGSPSAFNGLADLDPGAGSAFVAQLEAGDLPNVERGWQALDVLVISDVDTGALSPEQRAALTGWVAGGGRLIVAGGPSWQKTAAGVSDLLPLSPAAAQTVADLKVLGDFAASVTPAGSGVAASGSLAADAATLVEAGGLPLVASRRLGYGRVTFLALDPAFAPLKGWDGFEGLFRNILSIPVDRPGWVNGFFNWSSAHDAVNALPNLELPSSFQICGFLFVYLIIVGPLNYFVLKRLKRRELAWLTIPGIVIVFSGVAYVSGYQLSGNRATLHQLAVVQVRPDSDRAQVDLLVGLFSPRRSSYDLEFAPGFLVRPMPSSGYGNVSRSVEVAQGESSRLAGVSTDVASVEAFVAQGQVAAPQFGMALTVDYTSNGTASLNGTVTNLSDLTLANAVLLAPGPGNAQHLGDLKPGETRNISLYLGGGQARPALPNTIAPAIFVNAAGPTQAPPALPPNSDTTVDDIFGTSGGYYYNYNDREGYRRYSLFSSVLDQSNYTGRGNGVYLVGWTSTAPTSAAARITNRGFTTLDTTMYLIALRPVVNLGTQPTLTVSPALMTWTGLDISGQGGTYSPYSATAFPGDRYALRFAPTEPLAFSHVQALILHLTSYGLTGVPDLFVDVWDFRENTWSRLPGLIWGDNPIPDPTRFVGPGGEIQAQVENTGPLQVNVEALDFTLVVER